MTFLSQIFLQTSFPHQELHLLCTLFLSIFLFCHDLLSCFALLNTAELRANKTCILRIIILLWNVDSYQRKLTTQLKGRSIHPTDM